MTVLTRPEILKAITQKEIKIHPFTESQVGPGSIDLTLSNRFLKFKKQKTPVVLSERTKYHEYMEEVISDKIRLKPGETILGITQEQIHLSSKYCGLLEGRSRFARMGLMVHITASYMQPGIDNHEVLEIHNVGPLTIDIMSGMRICQLIVLKTAGQAKYKGIFRRQNKP